MKRSIKSIVLPIGVASALLVTPTTSHAHSDPTVIVEKHGLLTLLQQTIESIDYNVLAGQRAIELDLSSYDVHAGDSLTIEWNVDGRYAQSTYSLTEEDIANGSIEWTIQNASDLLRTLLDQVVIGKSTLSMTPIFTSAAGETTVGTKQTEVITTSLVTSVSELLDGLLDDLFDSTDLASLPLLTIPNKLSQLELAHLLSNRQSMEVTWNEGDVREGDTIELVIRQGMNEHVLRQPVTKALMEKQAASFSIEQSHLLERLLRDITLGRHTMTFTPVYVSSINGEETRRYGSTTTTSFDFGLLTTVNGLLDGLLDDVIGHLLRDVPLVGPTFDIVDRTANDLLSGLIGQTETATVTIDPMTLARLHHGDRLQVTLTTGGQVTGTIDYTLTDDDLLAGTVPVSFVDGESIVDRLLYGLLEGNKEIVIASSFVLQDGQTIQGESFTIEVDRGLLVSLDRTLDGLLSESLGILLHDLIGDQLLNGKGLQQLLYGNEGLLQLTDGGLLDGLVAELLGNGQLVNDLLGEKGLINLTNLIGQEGVVGGLLHGLLSENGLLGHKGLLGGMLSKEGVIGALLDDVLGQKGLVHRLLGNVALKDVSVTQLLDGILSAERGVLEPILGQKGLLGSLLGLNGKGGLLGGLLGKEGLLGGLLGGLFGRS